MVDFSDGHFLSCSLCQSWMVCSSNPGSVLNYHLSWSFLTSSGSSCSQSVEDWLFLHAWLRRLLWIQMKLYFFANRNRWTVCFVMVLCCFQKPDWYGEGMLLFGESPSTDHLSTFQGPLTKCTTWKLVDSYSNTFTSVLPDPASRGYTMYCSCEKTSD